MSAITSHRARNTLIDAVRPSAFPVIEFHLRKLNKFFIAENIYTVFPACQTYVNAESRRLAEQGRDPLVLVCLLFTFQESEGQLSPATQEELKEERDAFHRAVRKSTSPTPASPQRDTLTSPVSTKDTHISELIGYRPEAFIWKDKSRELFFDFSKFVKDTIAKVWPAERAERDTSSQSSLDTMDVKRDRFFMDWCDPATGLPMLTSRGASSFTDSDAIEQMFPYSTVLVAGAGGGCRMVNHPSFGLCVYPASAVLAFPADRLDVVTEALNGLCQ